MALKALLRFKLHSLINLLSLGFGFLCFISALLLANYIDSFDQHWPNADRIYNLVIRTKGDAAGADNFPIVNEPAARYLRTYFPDIPNIVKATIGDLEDIAIDGQAYTATSRYVEDRFFDIFPLEFIYGLETGQTLPPNTVAIKEEAAQRIFGRSDVIGERLTIDNETDVAISAVIGKVEYPSHLDSAIALFSSDFFIPMAIREERIRQSRIAAGADGDADQWSNQSEYVYLEIPEDRVFDQEEFHQELEEFVQATLPEDLRDDMTYELIPVNQLMITTLAFVTAGFNITSVLIIAGILVLLIGCLNYSNLVIAQLSLRSQEIAVQKILGSKRNLLILQYCFESLLFVCFTLLCVFGVLSIALSVLNSLGIVGLSPVLLLNPVMWFWLLLVIAVIVLIAGCYPAMRTVAVPLVTMMRPKGSSSYSGRLRALMVGMQFFVSGTLMILAFVMFSQNFAMTQQLDGDIADPKIVVSTGIDTFTADYELVKNELQAHPAVLSVSRVNITPWSISSSPIDLSRSSDLNETSVQVANRYVGHDFIETLDVDLVNGRDFSRERTNDQSPIFADLTTSSGPFSVLLDNTAAQALGFESAQAAIGESVFRRLEPPAVERELSIELTVIGEIDRVKYQWVDFGTFGITGDALTLTPEFANLMLIKISRDNVEGAIAHIEDTWSTLMPDTPLQREFVDNLFYLSYNLFRMVSVAIAVLSTLGFLIASIGLLGNATFITNIRRKEVGIRKVMGASSSRLLSMLLLDFAKPIIVANAIAWPVGYLVGNVYISLFATRAELTAMPFLLSFLLSTMIAVVAVASQSWKSAKVRPAMVLRHE